MHYSDTYNVLYNGILNIPAVTGNFSAAPFSSLCISPSLSNSWFLFRQSRFYVSLFYCYIIPPIWWGMGNSLLTPDMVTQVFKHANIWASFHSTKTLISLLFQSVKGIPFKLTSHRKYLINYMIKNCDIDVHR